jgi:Protein of unknown function (DUF3551)
MRTFFIVALVAFAGTTSVQRPAQAAEPPWCLFTKGGEEHCRYNSLDACLRDRTIGDEFCNPNPRYQGEPRHDKRPSRHGNRR